MHEQKILCAQEPFDHSLKIGEIARFIDKVVRAEFLRLHDMHKVAVCGEHDRLHRRVLLFNELQHCKPVDLRHLDIEQRKMKRLVLKQRQRFFPVIRPGYLAAGK
jgi:hypothetical protein